MISKKIVDRINLQINREMYSAYLYMAMSAKLGDDGYKGIATWMMTQYHEEMFHAMKFFAYLQSQGAMPKIDKIDAPTVKAKTVKEIFEATLEHEKYVTASIRELLELALAEKDYATENLVRWYVNEQVEEEQNAVDIIQKIDLIGENKQGLFMLNAELAARTPTIPLDYTAPFPAV
ncbi:MAG: ferritin [Spirochaetes bacterium]|nr:ferritin [Spirochaetota bacterium]MBU1079389.1 ferritin [Spirochaetota bacterium]